MLVDNSKDGKASLLHLWVKGHHPSSVRTGMLPRSCHDSVKRNMKKKKVLTPGTLPTLFTLHWLSWGIGLWLLLSAWRLYGYVGCVLENWTVLLNPSCHSALLPLYFLLIMSRLHAFLCDWKVIVIHFLCFISSLVSSIVLYSTQYTD